MAPKSTEISFFENIFLSRRCIKIPKVAFYLESISILKRFTNIQDGGYNMAFEKPFARFQP